MNFLFCLEQDLRKIGELRLFGRGRCGKDTAPTRGLRKSYRRYSIVSTTFIQPTKFHIFPNYDLWIYRQYTRWDPHPSLSIKFREDEVLVSDEVSLPRRVGC